MEKRVGIKRDNDNLDGCRNLAAAIVGQAVKDYLKAVRRLKRFPHEQKAKDTARECERFFREDAELWTDIDGESIIKAIREKVSRETKAKHRKAQEGIHIDN